MEMKREGLSTQAISQLTGFDCKTARNYRWEPEAAPSYGPRAAQASKLDPHKPYLQDRLRAAVRNAEVLLREIRQRGVPGRARDSEGLYAAATSRRNGGRGAALRGAAGHAGSGRKSRSIRNWERCCGCEAAFREWGAIPEEILYDRMKTVWLGSDERGEIAWHPVFLDFARYWGIRPLLCRPYRAQTKGKIESGVKYVWRTSCAACWVKSPPA